MSTTGSWEPAPRGRRPRLLSDGSYGVPPGWSVPSPCTRATGPGRSGRDSRRSAEQCAPGSTGSVKELEEERDMVGRLGLLTARERNRPARNAEHEVLWSSTATPSRCAMPRPGRHTRAHGTVGRRPTREQRVTPPRTLECRTVPCCLRGNRRGSGTPPAGMRDAGKVVAMLQLSYIPGLSRRGSWRAQIEAVRTRADYRGRGLGRQFLAWDHRAGANPRLLAGPVDHRQETQRGPPFLRGPGVCCQPRGHEAAALGRRRRRKPLRRLMRGAPGIHGLHAHRVKVRPSFPAWSGGSSGGCAMPWGRAGPGSGCRRRRNRRGARPGRRA